jgi:peptidoglycan/LPS O-acetylase OafA/YrhL
MHRDALSKEPSSITKFFGSKPMATLGSLAFPMFIVHGPIGQIFYKKAL